MFESVEVLAATSLLGVLEQMEPGAEVIHQLVRYDVTTLSEYDRVLLLKALEKQRCWLDAIQQPVIAAVAGERLPDGHDWGQDEVAAALRLSRMKAGERIAVARSLSNVLIRTLDALSAGSISYWHAAHLAQETAGLPVDVALEVESLALPKAVGDGVRPGEGLAAFRRTVQRALIQADPARANRERAANRADRKVSLWPTAGGTATVVADGLSAEQASRVMLAIRAWAGKTGADDPRTHDQRMADALVDICDHALSRVELTPAKARKAVTSLVLDFPTWVGLAENPAWLDGYGWIPASMGRELAADGAFRRLLTDPTSGSLLDATPDTYRPSERMRRYLVDRHRLCDHPICNRPAAGCDLDHTRRWADGGKTTRANLAPECERDHTLRHDGGWRLTRAPDGTGTWTSPAGHSYKSPPWDYRPLE